MSFLKTIFRSICWNIGKIITYIIIGLLLALILGKNNVFAASYSSYIWEEPSYIQFKNSSSTSLAQCNNSDICSYVGGNDAVGFYINYGVSKIDTPPMVQKNYKLSIEFNVTSANATTISTSSSAHKMEIQVRNSSSGAYTTATCDGGENLTITKENSATTRVKYTCSKLNVSSTVYVMALNYRYTPPNGYALPYWTQIIMEQNLAVIDLSDPNQSIIDSQISSANSIITNNDKNTEKLLDEIEKNNQAIKDTGDKIISSQDKTTAVVKENTETNKGILETIKSFFASFFGNLIDGILGLFVPNDFDFLDGFLETLDHKLGFIASVPIQFLEFMIDLVNVEFDEITSISLPSYSIMGYDLWEEIEIDFTDLIEIFKPYRIYTNIGCVSLCIYYLLKQYENFANGGGQ